jgi:hypothetical protein
MSTQINITVNLRSLYEKVKEVQAAARAAQLEREREAELERLAEEQNAIILRKRNTSFQNGRTREEPTLFYTGGGFYWLPTRSWIFDGYSENGVEKKTKVRIVGAGDSVSYDTVRDGGNSVLNLLNGKDSSSDVSNAGTSYLPAGTDAPTSPYISLYSGDGLDAARKTLEDAEPGLSEIDPAKYTLHHRNQLPVFSGDYAMFYKPFYNIYLETLDNTKVVSFATEPKKFSKSGNLDAKAIPINHGTTFEADNSSLFLAYHAYLIGRYETGTVTIRPSDAAGFAGNLRDVHVFITQGRDRNGFYSLATTGTSRFAVGDVVYWNNYALTSLEPQLYRYGTIIEISRGSFTYQNANPQDSNSRIETGLRLVIRLSTSLSLDPSVYHRLFNSTIVKMFTNIEEALDSQDTLWVDQLRLLGGYNNAWVTETIEGEDLGTPSLEAKFVGESAMDRDGMDCSKGGKAYFIQSVYTEEDSPTWRRQDNYHDGDVVAQRPGIDGTEVIFGATVLKRLVNRFVGVRFFEFDCAKNAIVQSFTTEVASLVATSTDEAIAEAMPGWFPSKRYRLAGHTGQLNLNKTETVASRRTSRFDIDTQKIRYYIKSWPINPTLEIEQLVQMLQAEAGATELEITQATEEMAKEISLPESAASGWGYTNTTEYFVSA